MPVEWRQAARTADAGASMAERKALRQAGWRVLVLPPLPGAWLGPPVLLKAQAAHRFFPATAHAKQSANISLRFLELEDLTHAARIGAEETVRNARWPLDGIFAATYWNRVERREQRGLVAEWLRRGLQILAPRFDSGRGLQCPSSRASAPELEVRVEMNRASGAASGLVGT